MLSDLLLLEEFYGHPSCAEFFESLSRRYGVGRIRTAYLSGDVDVRISCSMKQKRCWLISLTPQGREKAHV